MAINLMDLVKTAINTSGVADQIGSAVGLEKSKTNSAIEAAIPVLLGGLMKKASTPTGASELSNIFKKQDAEPSILDNLGSLVSGGANSKLLGLGTSLLPMLLGSSQASIVSVLMKLLGLGDKSVLGLLGSLAPIVMGVVGKQAKSAGGFDASILTNLLGGQNNFLSSALPNELKGVMGLADLGKAASSSVVERRLNQPRPLRTQVLSLQRPQRLTLLLQHCPRCQSCQSSNSQVVSASTI